MPTRNDLAADKVDHGTCRRCGRKTLRGKPAYADFSTSRSSGGAARAEFCRLAFVCARMLEELREQFRNPPPGVVQRSLSRRRGPIDAACQFAGTFLGRAQVSPLFHIVQHRIKRAGTQPVVVPGQLFDEPEAVNRSLGGMMEHVQADQPGIQLLIPALAARLGGFRRSHRWPRVRALSMRHSGGIAPVP